MRGLRFISISLLLSLTTLSPAQDKPANFTDDVTPILRNHCLKCHNPDKSKADLDLSSYNGALKGSSSGAILVSGDASASKLFLAVTHAEEPTMPPNSPKIPDAEIAVIRRWIEGGLLEKSGSKALAAEKPKANLELRNVSKGKPDGPPAMPEDWLLEPAVRTDRPGVVTALASSPWAPLVALGGEKQVLLYESDSQELLGILPLPGNQPAAIQFSRNGKFFLVGGGRGGKEGHALLCDVTSGECIATLGDEYDTVLAADVSSDLGRVALGGPGKQVKIYATSDGKLLHQMKKHTDWVLALEYSPDAALLASGDRNGGLFVWEATSGQEFYTLNGHRAAITAVSWRADSDMLLSASEDGTLKLWEMHDGKQIKSWNAHNGGVLSAAFTHDGRMVSCGRDNLVTLWDAKGNKQRSLQLTNDLPVRVSFSHDGKKVLATTLSGHVLVWDAANGKSLGELDVNPPTLAERIAIAEKESNAELVAKWKAAQFNIGVHAAREELEQASREHGKLSAEVEGWRAAAEQAAQEIETARKSLDEQPQKIKALESDAAKEKQAAELAESALKKSREELADQKAATEAAGDANATDNTALDKLTSQVAENETSVAKATEQWKASVAAVAAAEAESEKLSEKIKALGRQKKDAEASARKAEGAEKKSMQKLEDRKARLEKLEAEFQRLKTGLREGRKTAGN